MSRARVLLLATTLLSAGSRPSPPPRLARPAPPPPAIDIANWSPRAIREIYLSPASSDDWGLERLEGRSVAAGDDLRLGYGGGCRVDLRVVFDNGGAEERHDLDLCAHPFVGIRPGWTTSDDVAGRSPPALVAVRNRAGHAMARLYLFPDGAADEGADRLGNDVLPDGEETDVLRPIAATCDFSLHAVFEGDGGEERRDGIDLCRYRGVIIEPRPAIR